MAAIVLLLIPWLSASPPAVDCPLRQLVLNRSLALLPADANAIAIHSALQLDDCGVAAPPPSPPSVERSGCTVEHPAAVQYHVSATVGSDDDGDGSEAAPFATLHMARDAIRKLRSESAGAAGDRSERADVLLHAGTHHLTRPLALGTLDSRTRYAACREARRGSAVVSGASSSLSLTFTRGAGAAWVASTPPSLRNVEQLFVDGERLIWARCVPRPRAPHLWLRMLLCCRGLEPRTSGFGCCCLAAWLLACAAATHRAVREDRDRGGASDCF